MELEVNNKSVYVMSDIHNDADGFKNMLKAIDFSSKDILIIDGDVFDRGNKPVEIYFEILKYTNIYVVKGNHDMWVEREIREKYANEKGSEYIQYNTVTIMSKRLTPVDMINVADWIASKPYFINLTLDGVKYQVAHAQTFPTPESLIDKRKMYMGDMHYDDFIAGKEPCKEYISIVGHTPTEDGKIWMSNIGRIIRLDCGDGIRTFGSQSWLGALRLNDMQEFYV